MQETKKGRHYLFYRPEWAGYWDGARQQGSGPSLAVDVKTRCGTGTRGVLTVAPSSGKQWAVGRAPWEVEDLPEIPRALLKLVAVAESGRECLPC